MLYGTGRLTRCARADSNFVAVRGSSEPCAKVYTNLEMHSCGQNQPRGLQAIGREEASLKELQKHSLEIDATLDTLRTLPEKISHDVMVPFGNVAMFPGVYCSMKRVRAMGRAMCTPGSTHNRGLCR